mmetsp:Transcript_117916/g.328495  ORF Transcript_117916/g.328495 Transcript_117916/m.328495 type:complete len:688 (-) Transcript_117916:117-2180(-)
MAWLRKLSKHSRASTGDCPADLAIGNGNPFGGPLPNAATAVAAEGLNIFWDGLDTNGSGEPQDPCQGMERDACVMLDLQPCSSPSRQISADALSNMKPGATHFMDDFGKALCSVHASNSRPTRLRRLNEAGDSCRGSSRLSLQHTGAVRIDLTAGSDPHRESAGVPSERPPPFGVEVADSLGTPDILSMALPVGGTSVAEPSNGSRLSGLPTSRVDGDATDVTITDARPAGAICKLPPPGSPSAPSRRFPSSWRRDALSRPHEDSANASRDSPGVAVTSLPSCNGALCAPVGASASFRQLPGSFQRAAARVAAAASRESATAAGRSSAQEGATAVAAAVEIAAGVNGWPSRGSGGGSAPVRRSRVPRHVASGVAPLPVEESDAEAAEAMVTSVHAVSRGNSGPAPAPQRALWAPVVLNDLEIAMALQFEEGATAAEELHAVELRHAEDRGPSRSARLVLYVIEPCTAGVRCRVCGEPVPRQVPRIVFQRLGHRKLTSAHVSCLHLIEGLVRPSCAPPLPPATPPVGRTDRSAAVHFSHRLTEPERSVISGQLEELPLGPAAVQYFEWPQPPRQPSRRAELRRQLLLTERDFTPEDYEMLLELDTGGTVRHTRAENATRAALLRLPVSRMAEGAAGAQCSICLEDMAVGTEVRTLPCMHVFHRKCIDKWLMTPGGLARCPIDQQEVVM